METEIANLKAVHLEERYKKHYVTKEKRIELFSGQVEAILKELEQRDLKEVSTDKLFDILLRYIGKLQEEETSIKFKERDVMADIPSIQGTWEG